MIKLTLSEDSSDFEVVLELLLSSRPKIKDRTVVDAGLWDDGKDWLEVRPRKDDWQQLKPIVSDHETSAVQLPLIYLHDTSVAIIPLFDSISLPQVLTTMI